MCLGILILTVFVDSVVTRAIDLCLLIGSTLEMKVIIFFEIDNYDIIIAI